MNSHESITIWQVYFLNSAHVLHFSIFDFFPCVEYFENDKLLGKRQTIVTKTKSKKTNCMQCLAMWAVMCKCLHKVYNGRLCVLCFCAVFTISAVTMQLSAVMTQFDVDAVCIRNLVMWERRPASCLDFDTHLISEAHLLQVL